MMKPLRHRSAKTGASKTECKSLREEFITYFDKAGKDGDAPVPPVVAKAMQDVFESSSVFSDKSAEVEVIIKKTNQLPSLISSGSFGTLVSLIESISDG